jgi:hypothetical protein
VKLHVGLLYVPALVYCVYVNVPATDVVSDEECFIAPPVNRFLADLLYVSPVANDGDVDNTGVTCAIVVLTLFGLLLDATPL